MSRVCLSLCLLFVTGCAEMGMSGARLGVTAGGSQDIGLARDLIAEGQIPDQSQFTAEGLFSEHDLPLDGDVCDDLLCPRAASTVHRPLDGGQDKVMTQIGFGTNISADDFQRPDLDLALLVDVSCSMTGEPLDLAKDGIRRLLSELGDDDFVSVVEFGRRAVVRQRRVRLDDRGRARVQRAIDKLSIGGSTDMESGMREAYDQIEADGDLSGRLLVFTDAQPNTGVTEQSEFVQMVRDQAANDVGTTLFGTGQHLGAELADAISKVRGGSYHYVNEVALARLFTDEFDLMMTPVAFDLEVTLTSLEGIGLGDDVYGAPVDDDAVRLGASTLFLSKRNGGIAATFDIVPDEAVALGTLNVSYLPVGETERVSHNLPVRWEGGAFMGEADDEGVYKIAGLVDEYKALSAAASLCDGERTLEETTLVVEQTADRLQQMSDALADEDLATEATLMRDLQALLPSMACSAGDEEGV